MAPYDKHSAMIVHQQEPFNAEPPLDLLRRVCVTPAELFYVRNHGPVPRVDPAAFRLTVDGMVERPLTLTLDELREQFPQQTVTATLQCAGNRRDELHRVAPVDDQLSWGGGAVGNGIWRGVALNDLLMAAGLHDGARHVAFLGVDEVWKQGKDVGFGGSIPLTKAMGREVLLAYEMNGSPLPPVHGFPLRLVVPGYIGARSVKWLTRITLQPDPSTNYFQAQAYKLFPPHVRRPDADWNSGLMLGEFPVNATICRPADGTTVTAGTVRVEGYALAGGDRTVERVELSADGGEQWIVARLLAPNSPWAWRFWEATIELPPGDHRLVARAWDSAAHTQPEQAGRLWNFDGYMNNAWHAVRMKVVRPA